MGILVNIRQGRDLRDELAPIAGNYEDLVGNLQEKYGIAKDRAEQQVDEFKKTMFYVRDPGPNLGPQIR